MPCIVDFYTGLLLASVSLVIIRSELSVEVLSVVNVRPDGTMGRLALVGPAVDVAIEEINKRYSGQLSMRQTYLYNNGSASCSDLKAVETQLLAAYFYSPQRQVANVTALIYPGCFDERTQMAWMTNELDLLTVYGGAQNSTRLPQVIAAAYTNSGPYGRLTLAMLKMYRWTDVYVIYDIALSQFATYAKASAALLAFYGVKSTLVPVMCHVNVTFTEVLRDFRSRSRVLIFSASLDHLRKLLIDASALNMTNGEYVYYTVNTGADIAIYGQLQWQKNDSNDEVRLCGDGNRDSLTWRLGCRESLDR
ncbi:uncharacterized protein LOC129593253 [Paramacrobiotus metropolitanus]|uniref:uncharacterized protein LOC129593253 n=1 Tax=Paramacrobiotus metropolitanus TaxID=2943436 RepID=UPI002445E603|nr:uncharacterized protein LOC129593253 [Paramacrobiotus metropolitanus]